MFHNQIKAMRSNVFPEIKDWSDPQDDKRYAKVKELEFWDWFWLHHTGYTTAIFALYMGGILFLLVPGAWLTFFKQQYFFGSVLVLVWFLGAAMMHKNFVKDKPPGYNLYDLFMRDL